MPKRTDLRTILILGSGPIRIGQACEFDYSGAQACRVLRREGYRVVLVNSNPATIMTDPEWADATYLEPLDAETVAEVIERERPDAILPTLGGQTALNLAVELAPLGVELIGADLEAIRRAEDRELFRQTVHGVGVPTPRSVVAHSADIDFPVPAIVRPAFTLGGTGGGIAWTQRSSRRSWRTASLRARSARCWSRSTSQGWQEHELEVMCDARGNAVVVCSIENLDPMGVHTGDSWTVAPQQTLPDPVYQQLRDAAFATARAVGVATGGANVQFAVHPGDERAPRDRDEPARLALLRARFEGDRLPDRQARRAARGRLHARRVAERHHAEDDGRVRAGARLRGRQSAAVRLREVPARRPRLGAEMRAIGEALGLGRTFPEAFMKAMEGREASSRSFPLDDGELLSQAGQAGCRALGPTARMRPAAARSPRDPSRISPTGCARSHIPKSKDRGKPVRLAVDSCAGEFEAHTPYYYVTHEGEDEGPEPSGRAVIVLGGGPNRIGQAIEFDYCCVHAAQALQKLGYEAVLVNSNPETVSTDYDTSDRLYLEPLIERNVLDVCELEQPVGVAVSFGGQTPLKLAPALAAAGVPLLGDPLDAIDAAEDRGRFAKLAGDLAPEWGVAEDAEEAREVAAPPRLPGARPAPSRPRGSRHARRALGRASCASRGPCLVDRYLEGALELDVDALCDGESAWVAAVLEHVEPTGVHSGDSACVLPGPSVSPGARGRDPRGGDTDRRRASARAA